MDIDVVLELLRRQGGQFWQLTTREELAEWILTEHPEAAALEDFPAAVEAMPIALRVAGQGGLYAEAMTFAGAVIRTAVPLAARTAGRNWMLSVWRPDGPDPRVRLTVGLPEVLDLTTRDGDLYAWAALSGSAVRAALASGSLSADEMERRGLIESMRPYKTLGEYDAVAYQGTLDAIRWLYAQPAGLTAARLLCAQLVADGRFPHRKNYEPAAVAEAWAIHEAAGQGRRGFDRPYRGKPADGVYPELIPVGAAARAAAIGEHDALCRQLRDHLAAAGIAAGELVAVPADLAWRDRAGGQVIAEVKSCLAGADADRLRLGLGQVLDYRQRLAARGVAAKAVLLVSRVRDPAWFDICAGVGVTLLAGDDEKAWRLA
ncbi:hypothetical protein [Cryptosporangium aurantiacum]|uniref:Uncharacterized protein n=1 Tax=Cryptosporangium aurantiacum TaxID=134849 RepID=A0A1M7Q4S7_9ACTN|nr:hypothetical protein [Cryptosporangium aurantiacum]SHN25128.1 hypothetical protein SAMN05443668_104131 [Cryptosporangium aurantiacum]